MRRDRSAELDRRELLRLGLAALPVSALVVACAGGGERAAPSRRRSRAPASTGAPRSLPPTPACGGHDETPAQTEGPFFSTGSPERASLRAPGIEGTPLVVSGVVLSPECRPIAHVKLDFWQADASGEYDNGGFRLRGHQFSDESGRYQLETIVPGLYPGRTRHLHVKVQPARRRVLTTQLYFPGEARNATDGIFDEALLMDVHNDRDSRAATFEFVLDA